MTSNEAASIGASIFLFFSFFRSFSASSEAMISEPEVTEAVVRVSDVTVLLTDQTVDVVLAAVLVEAVVAAVLSAVVTAGALSPVSSVSAAGC